jgi:A118 family predicted phage portal protein
MDLKIRKQIKELFGAKYDPEQAMGANNYTLWLEMYRGEYPYVDGVEVVSLNLAATIASELARLTTLEMESTVNDESLQSDYEEVIKDARRFTEYGLALGDLILKPYPVGDRISVDYVTPDMFVPIGFDSFGRLTHVVFIDQIVRIEDRRKIYYTRLEEHKITSGGYTISNTAYRSEAKSSLGDQISLTRVDEWSELDLEASVTGYFTPLFGHFRNPQSNNLDLRSPMGISCFSKAASLIQDADEQYSRILWEYQGSELAIDADVTVLEASGNMPKHGDRLFRNLGLESGKNDFYQVFSPAIRDESLFNGLNQILRRVEYVCDLAYGTISDPNNVDKTAEEIRSSKQRSYATVTDIQKALENALTDLVHAMADWKHVKEGNVPPKTEKELEISFSWDDSLVVDSLMEQQIMMQEVAAGLIKPEKYLAFRYGVSEEEMHKWLPNMDPKNQIDYEEE